MVLHDAARDAGLNNVSVVADPIRQAGEAAEHTGKEHPGWVQAVYHDEPCELPSSLCLRLILFVAILN